MFNPYTTSTQDSKQYIQLLCGRKDDLTKILDHIILGHSLAIFGERRIGKTSLLYLLRDMLNGQIQQYANNFIDRDLQKIIGTLTAKVNFPCKVIYISFQDMKRLEKSNFTEYIRNLLIEEGWLATTLTNQHLLVGQIQTSPEKEFTTIKDIFHSLHNISKDKRFILLFDEIEALQDFPDGKEIAGNLRAVIQSCPRICMLFAGAEGWLHQIKDKTSPLVNSVRPFYLPAPVSSPVEIYLVKGLLEPFLPPSYDSSYMVRTIMSWTGSKTFYIQTICRSIIEKYYGTGNIPVNWEQVIEEQVLEETRSHLRDFYGGNNLDPLTKNILILIANRPGLTIRKIAKRLRFSNKVIRDNISDLVSLGKVNKQDMGYHIVGTLIETWGKQNRDIPPVMPIWPQQLKWGVAIVSVILSVFVYFYSHPQTKLFFFAIPNNTISIQMPFSVEEDENGKLVVSVQNIEAHPSPKIHLFFNSSTIDYQLNDTNELTIGTLAPNEKKFVELTYHVNQEATFATALTSQVFVTSDQSTASATYRFIIQRRLFPLQKDWLIISSFLTALGLFTNIKDIWQVWINLFSSLQGKKQSDPSL